MHLVFSQAYYEIISSYVRGAFYMIIRLKSCYKYLGKAASPAVERAMNYQVFQRGMAQLGKAHREIMDLLWKIGERKIKEGDEET